MESMDVNIDHKPIYVTRSSMPPFEEYIDEIKTLWDTHKITNMGEKHKELEEKLKEFLDVPNVSLMVNGHMALELAIQAMNLSGEVITTPYTFASTTHAIVRNGLKPVFCDVDPETYTIDVNKIEALITDKTTAIVPVHVYGNICDVEAIDSIAKKYHLKVIYDAAHAFGETYKGIGVGNFGDASMFSLHATKVYNSIEGGVVCYDDCEYGVDLYRLKNFGIRNPEKVDYVGANAKMNEFQAAMGLCNLRHLDEEISKRKKIHDYYYSKLDGVKGVMLSKRQVEVKNNYGYLPIIIDENEYGVTRDGLFDEFAHNNIFARKYFYPVVNEFHCYKNEYSSDMTPIALDLSRRVITLPLYADLEKEDVDRICNIIIQMRKR